MGVGTDDVLNVGHRLKEHRTGLGLTLQQIADGASLSRSFVSQIETGAAQPSFGSLKRITNVLGITLGDLFDDDHDDGEGPAEQAGLPDEPLTGDRHVRVVRAGQRKRIEWPNGAHAALLTPSLQGKLEVLLTTYDPAREIPMEAYSHEGEEFGFVMEGRYEVIVDGESYVLEAGDAICYPSDLPHSVRAIGEEPVKTIWVITPPSF